MPRARFLLAENARGIRMTPCGIDYFNQSPQVTKTLVFAGLADVLLITAKSPKLAKNEVKNPQFRGILCTLIK